MTVPVKTTPAGEIMESVIIKGDLSKLTPDERVRYYNETCKSIGLNPLTKPLEYITLNGKLTLYARRDAADQLRKINGISIEIVSQEMLDNLLSIHVRAKDNTGRSDEDLGVVSFVYPDRLKDRDGNWKPHPKAGQPLQGEDRANQILKCVTKAKRRVTLSISGLGFLDETEVEDIPAAAKAPAAPAKNVMLPPHDANTGEVIEPPEGDAIPVPPEGDAVPVNATVTDDGAAPAPDVQPSGPAGGGTAKLSVEDMAREAAQRGEPVFRTFYRNRSKQEQARINAIGDELRHLMLDAHKNMPARKRGDK